MHVPQQPAFRMTSLVASSLTSNAIGDQAETHPDQTVSLNHLAIHQNLLVGRFYLYAKVRYGTFYLPSVDFDSTH